MASAVVKLVAVLLPAVLAGCGTVGSPPRVEVRPNKSGIEVVKVLEKGPGYLISESWDPVSGAPNPPDLPARTILELQSMPSIEGLEGRYLISAPGTLQVADIGRYSDYPGGQDLVARWRSVLSGSGPLGERERRMVKAARLDEIPWMNAARCFHGKLRKRRFPWGTGVLFLTSYVQGKTGGPVNNAMLVLVVQGLTDDGRHAVNGRFEIRHPELPESSWDESTEGKAVFSIDDETDQAERWLDAQADDSFTPGIGQYEEFLRSISIESAGRGMGRSR